MGAVFFKFWSRHMADLFARLVLDEDVPRIRFVFVFTRSVAQADRYVEYVGKSEQQSFNRNLPN